MANLSETIRGDLELPAPGDKVYDRSILIAGWIFKPSRNIAPRKVQAFLGDDCIAETTLLSLRRDLSEQLGLRKNIPTGFRMLGKTSQPATEEGEATLKVIVRWDDDSQHVLVERKVIVVPVRLADRHYGEVVFPENETLLHRENIYGSGPPLRDPGSEATELLLSYLPPGASVIDIGCGAGAYGPPLRAAGHEWMGLESSELCTQILKERQLPFRRVELTSRALPAATEEWECGICVEVLEHVADPEPFLAEIARIIRRRALFTVPNMEIVPYMYGWNVVPWHLLEADHKNFFTRGSLRALLTKFFRRVEIFQFGQHPLIMREGIPVYVHLFAVADK